MSSSCINNDSKSMEEVLSNDNRTPPHAAITSSTMLKRSNHENSIKPPPPHKAAKKSDRKRSWKWPKDRPKRPLTAYNLFFQHERERLMRAASASASLNGNGSASSSKSKVGGFAGLARTVAAKWKTLSEVERQFFEAQAAQDKCRYNAELKAWAKKKQEEENTKKTSSVSTLSLSSNTKKTSAGLKAAANTTEGKVQSKKQKQQTKEKIKSSLPTAVALLTEGKAGNKKEEEEETLRNSSTPHATTIDQNRLGVTAGPATGHGLSAHIGLLHEHRLLSMNSHRYQRSNNELLTRPLLGAAAAQSGQSNHHHPMDAMAVLHVAALQQRATTTNRFDFLSHPEVVSALNAQTETVLPPTLALRSLLDAPVAAPTPLQVNLQSLARQKQELLKVLLLDHSLPKAAFY